MRLRLWLILMTALGLALSGCASFYAVETTPEGITRNIEPGDTVRVTTRDHGELTLLVMAINDYELTGRVDGKREDVLRLQFDRIVILEIQELNMRKALLSVVLPVVIAAIVACNNEDCRTQGVVDAQF